MWLHGVGKQRQLRNTNDICTIPSFRIRSSIVVSYSHPFYCQTLDRQKLPQQYIIVFQIFFSKSSQPHPQNSLKRIGLYISGNKRNLDDDMLDNVPWGPLHSSDCSNETRVWQRVSNNIRKKDKWPIIIRMPAGNIWYSTHWCIYTVERETGYLFNSFTQFFQIATRECIMITTSPWHNIFILYLCITVFTMTRLFKATGTS